MSAEDYGNIYDNIDIDLEEYENSLWSMPEKQLIDTITSYHDQNALNKDENGKKRVFPIGFVADSIRKNDYHMSQRQKAALIQTFSVQTLSEYVAERGINEGFKDAIDDLSKTELNDLSR